MVGMGVHWSSHKQEETEGKSKAAQSNNAPSKDDHPNDVCTKDAHTKDDNTKGDCMKDDCTKDDHTKDDLTKNGHTKDDHTINDCTKDDHTKDDCTKNEHTKNDHSKDACMKGNRKKGIQFNVIKHVAFKEEGLGKPLEREHEQSRHLQWSVATTGLASGCPNQGSPRQGATPYMGVTSYMEHVKLSNALLTENQLTRKGASLHTDFKSKEYSLLSGAPSTGVHIDSTSSQQERWALSQYHTYTPKESLMQSEAPTSALAPTRVKQQRQLVPDSDNDAIDSWFGVHLEQNSPYIIEQIGGKETEVKFILVKT